ncbi:MAG: PAS domain S-box protein [Rhodocyclaceae bacterium]|nr:MAG: PAS domain S-box protein [Rhodocyclaceae bacterium]
MKNLGIRQRVLLIALAPMTVIALALVSYFTLLRYGDVESALIQRGSTMARQLAPATVYGMFSGNTQELGRLVQAASKEADVSAISFFDRSGKLLASAGVRHSYEDPLPLPDGWQSQSADGEILFFHVKVVQPGFALDDPFYADGEGGAMRPLELGSLTIEISRKRVSARKREILVVSLLSVLVMLLATSLLARRLGKDITEPVVALEEAVRRIREGLLTTRVQPHHARTLQALEDGINAMAITLEAASNRSAAALASSEAELRKQYDFASALLQAQSDAGVGMMILLDGRVVFANEAAVHIHGYALEQLMALPDTLLLIPPEERPRQLARRQQLMESSWPGERSVVPILTKEGEVRHVEMVMMPLKSDARTPRLVVIEIDVTQRILDQARIEATNLELQSQRDEAERANRAKTRFLAAASHDLRQPLHALNLFAAELDSRVTTTALRRLSRQINTAVGSLGELLAALLDVSRLDVSELKPNRQAVALQPLLEAAALNHQRSADAKSLRLAVAPTSLWGESDPQYLSRIITNLIGNAVRYTRKGTVLVGVRRSAGMVRIEVWDTGIGVAPEHLPSLFQEFYQVHNPERDANKGLGLGLSIVDRLARALDHPVTVRSRLGKGTVFSVTLPRAAAPEPKEGDDEQASGARVLLAINDAPTCNSLAALLRGWGYRVSEAMNQDILCSILLAEPPDLVVCDDGLCEILFRQGNGATLKGLPLVVLGSLPESALATDGAKDIRIAGQLSKPLKPARLRALLRSLLDE